MNPPRFQARRATVDDLESLRRLWQAGGLPVESLEKRLTDFQVVETDLGELRGAIGLQIEGSQAKLHSEVYAAVEPPETLRPLLWERLQLVARNHGLTRLWTCETSPFWQQVSFQDPSAELRARLPDRFGDRQGPWRTLQLREEVQPIVSLEREFELFMQQQTDSTARVMRQARRLKVLATLLAIGLLGLVVVAVVYVLRRVPRVHLH